MDNMMNLWKRIDTVDRSMAIYAIPIIASTDTHLLKSYLIQNSENFHVIATGFPSTNTPLKLKESLVMLTFKSLVGSLDPTHVLVETWKAFEMKDRDDQRFMRKKNHRVALSSVTPENNCEQLFTYMQQELMHMIPPNLASSASYRSSTPLLLDNNSGHGHGNIDNGEPPVKRNSSCISPNAAHAIQQWGNSYLFSTTEKCEFDTLVFEAADPLQAFINMCDIDSTNGHQIYPVAVAPKTGTMRKFALWSKVQQSKSDINKLQGGQNIDYADLFNIMTVEIIFTTLDDSNSNKTGLFAWAELFHKTQVSHSDILSMVQHHNQSEILVILRIMDTMTSSSS